MSTTDLLAPILDGGIASVNFFNGRLLSGEDLSAEQSANREARRQLGRAVGDGIAAGLEVRVTTTPVVTVDAGLAVNRRGQTLALPTQMDVALVRPPTEGVTGPNGFADCPRPVTTAFVSGDEGVYVLVLAPASGGQGRAPVSGLGNVLVSCNTRYIVDGVRFRLVPLDEFTAAELADRDHLRNVVAHRCFGTSKVPNVPFGVTDSTYGALDSRRPEAITDHDVPLAVLHWTATEGVRFVDLWSVRRRIVAPGVAGKFDPIIGDRRLGEGEAILLQFQEQLAAIEPSAAPTLAADARFKFLPAAGYLPIGTNAFDWKKFLGPLAPPAATPIDGALLRGIIHRSLVQDPIAVGTFADAARAAVAPPVPVDVFAVPGRADVVVFARSARGRVRIFVTPTTASITPGGLYAEAPGANTRWNAAPAGGGLFVITDVPPGDASVSMTDPAFAPLARTPVTVVAGRTADISLTVTAVTGPQEGGPSTGEPDECVTGDVDVGSVIGLNASVSKVRLCVRRPVVPLASASRTGFTNITSFVSQEITTWLASWRTWLQGRGHATSQTARLYVSGFKLIEHVSTRAEIEVVADFGPIELPLTARTPQS